MDLTLAVLKPIINFIFHAKFSSYMVTNTSILVCRWIKETTQVFIEVKPQHAEPYTPIVNGYVTQSKIY